MIILGGEKSIALQTRRGTDIENAQYSEISLVEINFFKVQEKAHPRVRFRSQPSGFYNCHGMVFASRRTCIPDPQEVLRIIEDDEYEEVQLNAALPGDVVLYFEEGDIEHSATVISAPSEENLNLPWVVSKWGRSREAIHSVYDCPYETQDIRCYRITK